MVYIKKYWFIISIIVLCVIRFLISYNLPNFYLLNLPYDDGLMIFQFKELLQGNFLGTYRSTTLVKGIIFPILLYFAKSIKISYSVLLTILYILSCLYFIYALKKIIKYDIILILTLMLILFNPISYSSELFQRLYRNALSIIELLFFLGTIINIIGNNKCNIVNYIFLGIITSVMLLTRDDNLWTIIAIAITILYKIYKRKGKKDIIINAIPIIIIFISLNIISYINLKYYNIYTYNELSDTNFKKAYKKILQIKDNEKKAKTSITKSTLIKLAMNSKVLNITVKDVREFYKKFGDSNGEIYNGNMIWYFRNLVYDKNEFENGQEADEYFLKLSKEINQLFEEGKFEKDFITPSIFIYMPTINELKELPKNLINTIIYTSSYKNVKTFSRENLESKVKSNSIYNIIDDEIGAYGIFYSDYHNAENIFENNIYSVDILRNIYKYSTIILSLIALCVYLKYIRNKDILNLIIHLIVIIYIVIICGVSYTHTTAFESIRYCYLGNTYILQSLFIILNLFRLYEKKGT